MDFDLTAEQQELRAVVRAFADEVVAPAAEVHDREADVPARGRASRWPNWASSD